MFSETASGLIAIFATLITALIVLVIQHVTGSDGAVASALQLLVVAALTFIITFRVELAAMLRPSGPWKLAKFVRSEWSYLDSERNVTVVIKDEIRILQIGSLIKGRAKTISIENAPFSEFSYSITGVVNREGVLIAEWKNNNRGRNYYGSFIAHVARGGDRLSGEWIGVGTTQIHHGAWEWRGQAAPK